MIHFRIVNLAAKKGPAGWQIPITPHFDNEGHIIAPTPDELETALLADIAGAEALKNKEIRGWLDEYKRFTGTGKTSRLKELF